MARRQKGSLTYRYCWVRQGRKGQNLTSSNCLAYALRNDLWDRHTGYTATGGEGVEAGDACTVRQGVPERDSGSIDSV
jgi:hypothetical protein